MVISMDRRYPERLKTPRTVVVRFPYGRPFGRQKEPANQRVIVEDALNTLATAAEPVTIVELPYRWRRENWEEILASRRARAG